MKTWEGYQKGVNLGGWLSQCDDTEETYSTFVVEEDIKIIKGWGMDHVRLPFDYELIEDKDGNPVESGYGHIQDAIDWCGKYGLNMVLDLHKTMGYSFDDAFGERGFFDSEALQERFYKLWSGCFEMPHARIPCCRTRQGRRWHRGWTAIPSDPKGVRTRMTNRFDGLGFVGGLPIHADPFHQHRKLHRWHRLHSFGDVR